MLDVQYVRGDEHVYDDTGWTLGYLKNVDFKRVTDANVLKVPTHAWGGTPLQDTASEQRRHLISSATLARVPGPRGSRIALMHTWIRTQDEGWWRLRWSRWRSVRLHLDAGRASPKPNSARAASTSFSSRPAAAASSAGHRQRLPPRPAASLEEDRAHAEPRRHRRDRRHASRPRPRPASQSLQRFVEDGGLLVTARDTSIGPSITAWRAGCAWSTRRS